MSSHPVKVDKETLEKLKEIKRKTGWSYTYIIKVIFAGINVDKIPEKKYIIKIETEGKIKKMGRGM